MLSFYGPDQITMLLYIESNNTKVVHFKKLSYCIYEMRTHHGGIPEGCFIIIIFPLQSSVSQAEVNHGLMKSFRRLSEYLVLVHEVTVKTLPWPPQLRNTVVEDLLQITPDYVAEVL